MGDIFSPLVEAGNPDRHEAAIDRTIEAVQSQLRGLPDATKAELMSRVLNVIGESTLDLIERKLLASDATQLAVDGLTRTFMQRGNWVASKVTTRKY